MSPSVSASGKPLRVLLVEDSDDDAELLLHALKTGGYHLICERVETAEALQWALRREPWQLVLSDYSLPTLSAPEALRIVRERDPELPFIIVSGTVDEETAVSALKAGAADFVVKGRLTRLIPAIEREIGEAERRRQRRHAHDALQETLRDERARSAYALAAAGAGVWEIDVATSVTRCSDLVGPMFGLPAEPFEMMLDGFRTRVHPDDWPMITAALTRSIDTDAPYRVHFRSLWPDGTSRWINSKGRVIRNDEGTPLTVLGIAIDITERKELEQQLQQSQKMESLGQLAGGIAHDFNNVLTAILGFSELLIEQLSPQDPRAQDAAEIRKAAESGQQLTRQLRAFSRQQAIEPTRLNVNKIVNESKGILQRLLGARAQLETVLDSTVGNVWADAGQLQQILVNLGVNAKDAMPEGGRLTIETSEKIWGPEYRATHPDVVAGPYMLLAVTDTGTGMSPETKARIFEPFFTTKGPDKGTGLGLAMVYGIVRQSGGFIDVISSVGHGTTFRIYLPLLTDS